MELRSKHVLLAMAVIIVGAVGFSVWYHSHRTQRVRAAWGAEFAARIMNAPLTELLLLEPGDANTPAGERLRLGDTTWKITRRKDVSFTPAKPSGLRHLREFLIVDETYDWEAQPKNTVPGQKMPMALAFHQPDQESAVVLVDLATQQATLLPGGPTLVFRPHYASAFEQFLDDQTKTPGPLPEQR